MRKQDWPDIADWADITERLLVAFGGAIIVLVVGGPTWAHVMTFVLLLALYRPGA